MIQLVPFSKSKLTGEVKADFRFESQNLLTLTYIWPPTWDLAPLSMPQATSLTKARASDLWKSTCFEAFLKSEKPSKYWEINLSPQNLWNVYEFETYRHPAPPQEALQWNLMSLDFKPGELSGIVKYDFGISKPDILKVGLTCIFENRNGEKSYWALTHNKSKPDFHDETSFLMEGRPK